MIPPKDLKERIKIQSNQLGFILAGVTTPDPPPHLSVFEDWLKQGRHASMAYLARDRSRASRADPRLILPECKSILVLAIPYSAPSPESALGPNETQEENNLALETGGKGSSRGRVAAYAWGADYHLILRERLQALTAFIEREAGRPVSNRWYTDTGPILDASWPRERVSAGLAKIPVLSTRNMARISCLPKFSLTLTWKLTRPLLQINAGRAHAASKPVPPNASCLIEQLMRVAVSPT